MSIGLLTAAARTAHDLGPNATAYVIAVTTVGIIAIALHRTNNKTNAPAIDDDEPGTTTSVTATDERIRS